MPNDNILMWVVLILVLCASVAACVCAIIAAARVSASRRANQAAVEQLDRLQKMLREESEMSRAAAERQDRENREEVAKSIEALREALNANLSGFTDKQSDHMEKMRESVERRLSSIQLGNERKLDEMRGVVDEKLTRTLEERLGSSFKMVSDQLEQVYKNLGEMRSLSRDMGDIKNIFANVKTRGTWGEVQLGALLELMLTNEQFSANVKVRPNTAENVEYAIKLPGPDDYTSIWLPIDSKFPVEDYQRMMQAREDGDLAAAGEAERALEARVLQQARTIRDKYICPPYTTDFAVMFVPIESLFAEILRRPGLSERIQREYRVTVAGPTTLSALLNSLRMGFKTLAIQKRSSEVWKLLGVVKKQFHTFGTSLEAVEKHLERASKGVREATNRTNIIQKRLDKVEDLPEGEGESLFSLDNGEGSAADD